MHMKPHLPNTHENLESSLAVMSSECLSTMLSQALPSLLIGSRSLATMANEPSTMRPVIDIGALFPNYRGDHGVVEGMQQTASKKDTSSEITNELTAYDNGNPSIVNDAQYEDTLSGKGDSKVLKQLYQASRKDHSRSKSHPSPPSPNGFPKRLSILFRKKWVCQDSSNGSEPNAKRSLYELTTSLAEGKAGTISQDDEEEKEEEEMCPSKTREPANDNCDAPGKMTYPYPPEYRKALQVQLFNNQGASDTGSNDLVENRSMSRSDEEKPKQRSDSDARDEMGTMLQHSPIDSGQGDVAATGSDNLSPSITDLTKADTILFDEADLQEAFEPPPDKLMMETQKVDKDIVIIMTSAGCNDSMTGEYEPFHRTKHKTFPRPPNRPKHYPRGKDNDQALRQRSSDSTSPWACHGRVHQTKTLP